MTRPQSQLANSTLQGEYASALHDFLSGAGEAALARAYEIGRRAGNEGVGILDLVRMHDLTLKTFTHQSHAGLSLDGAGQFLLEALSPFEMSLRAYKENARLLGLSGALARENSEINRAREQLRSILDATTAVIYLRDTSDRILFVNRRFERVFGTGELPDAIDTVLRGGDRQALVAKEPLELEEVIALPDGDHTYISLKFPLLDDLGAPYAVCCVATDISERKRASEAVRTAKEATEAANRELRATQAQLVQSAKMASLGELVAGVAHEVNNPLAFAIAHLQTATRSLARVDQEVSPSLSAGAREEWERAQARIREMRVGLERIRELVIKLRTFSRLDEGEWKQASLRDCIESVLMLLGHRLKDRAIVELSLDAPDTINCYPGLLNQALLNVLANALDAMPEVGELKIQTCSLDGGLRISVTDNGPGIPLDLAERVFEPFFSTKPIGQGTGLGLSITYSIVQRHGGTISLETPPEGGTTVVIGLPSSVFDPMSPAPNA